MVDRARRALAKMALDRCVPVEVDYSRALAASDEHGWEAECEANIKAGSRLATGTATDDGEEDWLFGYSFGDDWLEELDTMEPCERQYILDELAARQPDWQESEMAHGS
jgi:hypothetical protein